MQTRNDGYKVRSATFTTRVTDAYEAIRMALAIHEVDLLEIKMAKSTKDALDKLIKHYLRKHRGRRLEINSLIILAILCSIRDSIIHVASKDDINELNRMIVNLKMKIKNDRELSKKVKLDILGMYYAFKLMHEHKDMLKDIDIMQEKYRSVISIRIPREHHKVLEIFYKYKDKANIGKSQVLKEATTRVYDIISSIPSNKLHDDNIVDEVLENIVMGRVQQAEKVSDSEENFTYA